MQLKDSLQLQLPEQDSVDVQIIAETGWTTTSLKNALTHLLSRYAVQTALLYCLNDNNRLHVKGISQYGPTKSTAIFQ